jgi:hypothetical protein
VFDRVVKHGVTHGAMEPGGPKLNWAGIGELFWVWRMLLGEGGGWGGEQRRWSDHRRWSFVSCALRAFEKLRMVQLARVGATQQGTQSSRWAAAGYRSGRGQGKVHEVGGKGSSVVHVYGLSKHQVSP